MSQSPTPKTLLLKSPSIGPVWHLKYKGLKTNSERSESQWTSFPACSLSLSLSLSLILADLSLHWLLQIPEDLQLPGSEPHLMSIRSNQWNRTAEATDICRYSIHGTPRRPVQTAGYQDPALPATVSRTPWGLSLFTCLLFLCMCMLNPASFLTDQHSRRTFSTGHIVLAPSDLSCSQMGSRALCALCNREAVGDWCREEGWLTS